MLRRLSHAVALLAALLAPLPTLAQSTPISGLPAATAPIGTELVPLVQGGATKQAALSALVSGLPSATTASKGLFGPLSGNATDCVRGNGSMSPCPSGGGGGDLHPGYRSGDFYRMAPTAGSSNSAVVANRLYLVPFLVTRSSLSATALGLFVGTAGAGGTACYVGIYANSGGRGGALIGSVSVPTDVAGQLFSTTLASLFSGSYGAYWGAVLCNGTPAVASTGFGDSFLAAFVGSSLGGGGGSAGNAGMYVDGYAYSSGLPATFPTAGVTLSGGNAMPVPYFRAQ